MHFNQGQQEESIDDVANTRMMMVCPGVYGHHQFTAIEQQQMVHLKIRMGLKSLLTPRSKISLTQLRDEILYQREDPILSSIMVLFHVLIRVE